MKKGLLYLHGKGGSAREAERYEPLFPDYDVVGFDYKAQTPWEAKEEFSRFFDSFAETHGSVVLIANSLGAWFALNALSEKTIERAFFISPVVKMEALILDLLARSGHTERELLEKGTIETDFGETLSMEYLRWVRAHPVFWKVPTSILYGENDLLQPFEAITDFAAETGAVVTVMKGGEHWFHTKEQLEFLDGWIRGFESGERLPSGAKEYEKSCGAVLFRKEKDGLSFVLVTSPKRYWGFPKGHIERGETEKETAIREIREETSLQVRFLEGFRAVDEHPLLREGRPNSIKRTVYFLAQYENQTPVPIDPEIAEVRLMNYGDAYRALYSERLKEILKEANDFLCRHGVTF